MFLNILFKCFLRDESEIVGKLITNHVSILFSDNLLRYNGELSNSNHLDPNPLDYIINTSNGTLINLYNTDSTFISDSSWVRLSAPIHGKKIKEWITVGNFKKIEDLDLKYTKYPMTPSTMSDSFSIAYIFMDDFALEAIVPMPSLQDLTLCEGDPLNITIAPSGYDQIRWSTGETGEAVTLDAPGEYWIEASIPGCHVYRATRLRFKPWNPSLSLPLTQPFVI